MSKISAIANWYGEYEKYHIKESDIILVLGNIVPSVSAWVYNYWLSRLPSKNVFVMQGDRDNKLALATNLPKYENVTITRPSQVYDCSGLSIQMIPIYSTSEIGQLHNVTNRDILCLAISKNITVSKKLLDLAIDNSKCKKLILSYPNTEVFNEVNFDIDRVKNVHKNVLIWEQIF